LCSDDTVEEPRAPAVSYYDVITQTGGGGGGGGGGGDSKFMQEEEEEERWEDEVAAVVVVRAPSFGSCGPSDPVRPTKGRGQFLSLHFLWMISLPLSSPPRSS